MSQQQPVGDFRGILEPDARTNGAYLAATTQAGARAGHATPGQATAMALVLAGTIDASVTSDADIATHRAGMPGVLGGTFKWRPDGTTDYYSWDPPTAISGWEFINRSTTANEWGGFHAVRLGTGLLAVSAIQNQTDVVVWTESIAATWTSNSVRTGGASVQACLVEPDAGGRLICLSTKSEATGLTQIRMDYSDDDGDTWSVGATNCLDAPIGHGASTINRIRAVRLNGQIALFLWISDTTDIIQHWAGDAAGSSFTKIETFSSADKAGLDVIVHNGEILVALIEKLTAGTYAAIYGPRLYRIASAFQLLSTSSPVLACDASDATIWGIYSAGAFTSAECALAQDDDGTLYVFGRCDSTQKYAVTASISTDHGTTWGATYQSRGSPLGLAIYDSRDTTTRMKDLAVVAERGRFAMFHRWVCGGGTMDDSMCLAWLGGYTTVPMPDDTSADLAVNVAGWYSPWLAINLPTDATGVWTGSTSGAPTNTLGSSGLRTTTTNPDYQKWTATPTIDTGKEDRGVMATFQLDIDSGSGECEVRASDGTHSFWVRVTVTTTSITLRDVNAGSDIGSPISTSAGSSGVEIRIAVGQPSNTFTSNVGYVAAWYRSAALIQSSNIYGPRGWTSIGTSTTLVKDNTTTSLVSFANLAGTSDITWRWVAFESGTYLGPNPPYDAAGIRGRFFASAPVHVWRGLTVAAQSGPTVRGDTWATDTFYDYGVANLDPWSSPSPRRPWRSTNVGADQDITLTLDAGHVAGDIIGLYLQGCNFKTCSLYQDSGAAVKVADISLIVKGGLAFDRTRDQVRPKSGGSDFGTPLLEDRFAGCWWVDSLGGTPRRIRTNEHGHWAIGATTGYRPTRLYLESYGGGDLTTGAAGQVWSDRVLIITQLLTSTDTLTLRIPYLSNAGVASYFQIGTMAIGRMHLLEPRGYAYPSRITETGTERLEGRYGSTRSRRILPTRQPILLPFTDGYDTTAEYGTTPDYFTLGYASAPPLSDGRPDIPSRVEGILRRIGSLVPVAFADQIPQQASAPTDVAPVQINDPQRLAWAWIDTDTLQTDVVVGSEYTDQNVRMGTVKLVEVV